MHKKNEKLDNLVVRKCEIIDSILSACGKFRKNDNDSLSEILDALRFDWVKLCELNRQTRKVDLDLNTAKQNVSERIKQSLDRIEGTAREWVNAEEVQSGIRNIQDFLDSNAEVCGRSHENSQYKPG